MVVDYLSSLSTITYSHHMSQKSETVEGDGTNGSDRGGSNNIPGLKVEMSVDGDELNVQDSVVVDQVSTLVCIILMFVCYVVLTLQFPI